MNILIYGLGSHGIEIEEARYLMSCGHSVCVVVTRETHSLEDSVSYLREIGCTVLFGDSVKQFDYSQSDIVIKSQTFGIPVRIQKKCKAVTNDLGFFLSSPLLKNIKLIGITGERDKSLTGSCICSSLNQLGLKAHLCGNNGSSIIEELEVISGGNVPDVIVIVAPASKFNDVIESDFTEIPDFEIFAITAGNPDVLSKTIGTSVKKVFSAKYIVYPEKFKSIVTAISGRKRKGLGSIESLCSRKPKSVQASMDASFAVLRRLGYRISAIKRSLDSFKGIPNSSELVIRTENSIWYNSSFVDVPEAVGVSFQNFSGLPVHIIIGGDAECRDVSVIREVFDNAKSIHLLSGTFTESSVIPYLKANNIHYYGPFTLMSDAVLSCINQLDSSEKSLEVVLLAPGAMCYRSFGSEGERGIQFKNCVNAVLNKKKAANSSL